MLLFIKKLRKRKNNIRGEKRTKGTRESIHSLLSGKVKIKQLFPKLTLAKFQTTQKWQHTQKRKKHKPDAWIILTWNTCTHKLIPPYPEGTVVSMFQNTAYVQSCVYDREDWFGGSHNAYFLWGLWVMHSHQSSIFHIGSGLLLWPCLEELELSQGEHSLMTQYVCKPYDCHMDVQQSG